MGSWGGSLFCFVFGVALGFCFELWSLVHGMGGAELEGFGSAEAVVGVNCYFRGDWI